MHRRFIPYLLLVSIVFLLIPAVAADDASDWYVRGQTAEAIGDNETALKYYQNAIAADPNYLAANAGKATVLNNLGRYEEALAAADIVLSSRKDSVAAEARAYALLGLGRYEEAVTAYDLAFSLRQNVPEAYCNQARAYVKLDEAEKALAAYDKCVKLDPVNLGGWNEKGLLLFSLGKYEEAIDAFNHCTRIIQSDPILWNNKGLAYAGIEDYENAMSCFKTALNLDPTYAEAQQNLDKAYLRKPFVTVAVTTIPDTTVSTVTATITPKITTQVTTDVRTAIATSKPPTAAQPVTTKTVAETKTTYAPLSPAIAFLGILGAVGIILGRDRKI